MKQEKKRRTWAVWGLSATLMGGMIVAGLTPAQAHSEERYSGRDRDRDGIRNYRDGDRDRGRNYRDWDRDGVRNRRDWDRDGDGIPNFRDPHPNRPDRDRHVAPPRFRDRDRDGTPNWRDRRPDNPYRR